MLILNIRYITVLLSTTSNTYFQDINTQHSKQVFFAIIALSTALILNTQ